MDKTTKTYAIRVNRQSVPIAMGSTSLDACRRLEQCAINQVGLPSCGVLADTWTDIHTDRQAFIYRNVALRLLLWTRGPAA